MPKDRPAPQASWLDKPFFSTIKLNWETGLIALLILAAFVTRFYGLGDRVMSHDETTHVVFSWNLFKGQGYAHDPLSHGPLQFHLLALSYFLFGDNDFTARAPQALFSVLTVFFVWWAFRRYLGRIGALLAAFFFLISPYMLYYGRYARNESWVALFGLVMLWGMLRYLDRGENKYLYITTAALALHFAAKETSFIYVAQALLFLGLLFLVRIDRQKWISSEARRTFFVVFLLSASLLLLAPGAQLMGNGGDSVAATSTDVVEPAFPTEVVAAAPAQVIDPIPLILGGAGLIALAASIFILGRGYGWQRLRQERSFGLMLLMFTLVLPHLAALPLKILRPDLTYTYFKSIFQTGSWSSILSSVDFPNVALLGLILLALLAVATFLGLLWNPRVWLINMGIFFAIFIPLFTTLFTNSLGLFTGLIGSLGYWVEQQAVQRGSQPWYYYGALQIPVYEFLAAIGSILAVAIGLGLWQRSRADKKPVDTDGRNLRPAESRRLALVLLAFWAVTALVAYTIAGEKMPWLTVHIALPMLLLAGWSFGWILKRIDWARLTQPRGILVFFALVVLLLSTLTAVGALLGTQAPFKGMEQIQLQATMRFVFYVLLIVGSSYALFTWTRSENWKAGQLSKTFTLIILAGLALLTARAAFRAAYINYDEATEYLVYAHMARGPKAMMEQLEELSLRTTDGLGIQVAYDNETNYPLWWYLRNYPNKRFYDQNPTSDLRDFPVIIVGDTNYGKIEPIVRDSYYMFEFIRIWWPNQDYFDYTRDSVSFDFTAKTGLDATQMSELDYVVYAFQRLAGNLDTPEEREAIFDVWLNRDFNAWLELRGQDPSLAQWNPSRTMRMYVRKDIAAQIWDFGVEPVAGVVEADPYQGKGVELGADVIVGGAGNGPGQFNSPRGVAVAPDGSVYVADSLNHRIQHLAADGSFISQWGTPSDPTAETKPGGTFNEPWGVAVSPDGRFVYVADTWNHRIQKFTADGAFITMWGGFGDQGGADLFYGPRDLVVDGDGNILVTDTGNKRIVVYDANGNFISEFGTLGSEAGQFNEPVGLTLDRENGLLYVADTWNQRIQVLSYSEGTIFPLNSWEISGWFGQSLLNKPYLSLGIDGRLYVSDPESGRVLVFEPDGSFVYFFGGYEQSAVNIAIAQGVATDGQGGLWLSDGQNNQIFHFVVQ